MLITVLKPLEAERKPEVDLKKYMGRGEKMFHYDAQEYVKELRANDRL